jgi:hypothetical protein
MKLNFPQEIVPVVADALLMVEVVGSNPIPASNFSTFLEAMRERI